jgi:protein-tyrosine-phosphatase
MEKVLCVCVANSSRSPMMQAVLQQHLGEAYQVESAGLRKEGLGSSANERSILCLKERGIDLTGHRRRYIADLDLSQYPWIVCVGPAEAAQVRAAIGDASTPILVPNAESGGIPDPYEHGLQGYRECLALLDVAMPEIARQITSLTHLDPAP